MGAPVINVTTDKDGAFASILFFCPGCKRIHSAYTQDSPAKWTGPRWTFNHDLERPVLSPSFATRYHREGIDSPGVTGGMCHAYVGVNGATPGSITFLSDSTHELTGQTVPMVAWDERKFWGEEGDEK